MKIPIPRFVLNYFYVYRVKINVECINISYSLSTVYNKYVKFKFIKFQNSF